MFRVFKITVIIFVLVVIGLGFYFSGSPQDARLREFDQQKLSDLRRISYSTERFYRENNKLPSNLKELRKENNNLSITDPQHNKVYKYKKINKRKYELCANFNLKSEKFSQEKTSSSFKNKWNHKKGEECFQFEVNNPNRNDNSQIPHPQEPNK